MPKDVIRYYTLCFVPSILFNFFFVFFFCMWKFTEWYSIFLQFHLLVVILLFVYIESIWSSIHQIYIPSNKYSNDFIRFSLVFDTLVSLWTLNNLVYFTNQSNNDLDNIEIRNATHILWRILKGIERFMFQSRQNKKYFIVMNWQKKAVILPVYYVVCQFLFW